MFGATAAAARLLGLPAETATRALGVAGSFAGGLLEFLSDGSDTKPLHAGWAAHAGLWAAELAAGARRAGQRCSRAASACWRHSSATACPRSTTPTSASAGSSSGWPEGLSDVPLVALRRRRVEELIAGGLDPAAIDAIEATVPSGALSLVLEPAERKRAPATPYEAKFSLPFCLAETLVHVELASFTAARIADPETLRLAGRVEGRAWPAGEEPAPFAGAVRVTTGDGGAFDAALVHPPGSPGNPLAHDAVLEKFRANAALALAPEPAADLEAALLDLARVSDLGAALTPLADAAPR